MSNKSINQSITQVSAGGTRGRAGRGVAGQDRGGLKESVAEDEFH